MNEDKSKFELLKPYLLIVSGVVVLLIIVLLWPSSEPTKTQEPVPVQLPEPVVESSQDSDDTGITDMIEPEVFETPRVPTPTTVDSAVPVVEFEAQEIIEDEVIDDSDASVKSALLAIAESPMLGKLLVNDGLLQKFVVNVHSMSEQDYASNDALFALPDGDFKVYQQSGRTWIDRDSFARYTPYVEVLESVDLRELIEVYDIYKPRIEALYEEISLPGSSFDDTLLAVIDELLDTPRLPLRIEVFSDSVMYKFKDEKIEQLSPAQKQLLRTGPDNMRRIKSVLRLLKLRLEIKYS